MRGPIARRANAFFSLRFAPCVLLAGLVISGCLQGAIDENNRQLAAQQTQLDQLKQQVAALQSQRAYGANMTPAPGACDTEVMREATRKGGARFAAGDFAQALGYYQDAVSACGTNPRAQLNLARTFEAVGDRAQATAHYQLAAASKTDGNGSGDDATAVHEASEALARVKSSN
jgi:tetratricopeptide (TPR) repeat protein